MRLKQITCSSCQVYQACYQICCVGIYLCRECLLDQSIIDECYVCPVCNRQLAGAYRPLIMMTQFNDQDQEDNLHVNQNRFISKPSIIPTHPKNPYQPNPYQNVRQEDFQFVQNLSYQNSQLKRNKMVQNNNQFLANNYNQGRLNTNQGPNPQHLNMLHKNQSFTFGNQNFAQPNQFVQRNDFRQYIPKNNFVPINTGNKVFQSNVAYQNQMHSQSELYSNNYQTQTNMDGFTQNIRQRKRQTEKVFENKFIKTSCQNNRSQQNLDFKQRNLNNPGNLNNLGSPFDQLNQQKLNANLHPNNFNPILTNGNNHMFSGSNQMIYQDNLFNQQKNSQRVAKSAMKMRRVNHSPSNGNIGNFRAAQYHGRPQQNYINEQKDLSYQKDLSPTFGFQSNQLTLNGQIQKFEPTNKNLSTIKTAHQQQTRQIIKMRRSNSEYTLGSRKNQ